jgi:hypothetical protein
VLYELADGRDGVNRGGTAALRRFGGLRGATLARMATFVRRFSLNNDLPTGILYRVPRFTKYVAMVMLAVCGLATSHCALEHVPGLEFLAWCHHPDTAPHEDNDCDGDGCAAVERGFYKVEDQAAVPAPLLVLSFVLPQWEARASTPAPHPLLVNCSPPELPRAWQFSYRTALPPRAPSPVA